MIHCYAFDPGEVSGWCHISVHEGEVGIFNCGETDHIGVGNMLYDNPALKFALDRPEIDVTFLAEKFMMNTKVTPQPWSLETIGLIRYFADKYQVPFIMSSPSQHKGLISDKVIKKAGLWVPGKGHAMDSVRVALLYLTTKKKVLQECLI